MSELLHKAITDIEEARESHVYWRDFVIGNPEAAAEPEPRVDVAGDASHHELWIHRYDNVLELLKGMQRRAGGPHGS